MLAYYEDLTCPVTASIDWRSGALCAQVDPEVFFPEKGRSNRAAKAVCALCPVAEECLAYALEHGERFGVWGGLTERQRRHLRRAARRNAEVAA